MFWNILLYFFYFCYQWRQIPIWNYWKAVSVCFLLNSSNRKHPKMCKNALPTGLAQVLPLEKLRFKCNASKGMRGELGVHRGCDWSILWVTSTTTHLVQHKTKESVWKCRSCWVSDRRAICASRAPRHFQWHELTLKDTGTKLNKIIQSKVK